VTVALAGVAAQSGKARALPALTGLRFFAAQYGVVEWRAIAPQREAPWRNDSEDAKHTALLAQD
jgi:hypothetical protein